MAFWQRKIQRYIFITLLLSANPVLAMENINWIKNYEQGLSLAASKQKPAFIYFHAYWCSWCKVYEQGTLGNQQIIKNINQYYVPVLVNFDARPDLVEKYRGFGLPFTVIVSHKDELLARLPGILNSQDMLKVLQQTSNLPTEQALSRSVSQLKTTLPLATHLQEDRLNKQSYQKFLASWLEHIENLYDPITGTFSGILSSGATLKRPAPHAWTFLLEHFLWKDRTKRAALVTLNNLYDNKHGGFFYFRNPHRSDKHLETAKLLDANAWLIYWFTQTGKHYQNDPLITAAKHGSHYLQSTLWDHKNGGFFQAQISDAEYYQTAETLNKATNKAPAIDKIKRTDSNAQAAIALFKVGRLTNSPAEIKMAKETLRYIMTLHLRGDRLYHSSSEASNKASNEADKKAANKIAQDVLLGDAVNLGGDIFWLLAALQIVSEEKNNSSPLFATSEQIKTIYQLANQWLTTAQQNESSRRLSNPLLGIIAWTAVNSNNTLLPKQTAAWALQQIRLEVNTRPDDLVYALKAWQLYLKDTTIDSTTE